MVAPLSYGSCRTHRGRRRATVCRLMSLSGLKREPSYVRAKLSQPSSGAAANSRSAVTGTRGAFPAAGRLLGAACRCRIHATTSHAARVLSACGRISVPGMPRVIAAKRSQSVSAWAVPPSKEGATAPAASGP